MCLVRVGEKGQVSIPKAILDRLGIRKSSPMLVEVTEDGGLLLRQVGVYPLEIYTEERVSEFEEADRLSAGQRKRLKTIK